MGITQNDIAAQRAMLERGKEKRKADWKQAERERLRDTFAAAALTGLLAGPGDKDFSMDYWARHAYGAADAMLRERERVTEPMPKEKRAEVPSLPVFADNTGSWPVSYEKSDEKRVLYDTNHDAPPEARATKDERTPKDAVGTGNTQKPVAWAVFRWWDNTGVAAFCQRDEADDWRALETADTCHRHDVVPLYRHPHPTLTDEERAALMASQGFWALEDSPHAATLRSLLSRLS